MGRRRGQTTGGESLEFFARCAGGFEDVLGQELRALRLRRVRPQVGGVIFFGSLADGYRACLWSRVATRIQLVVARVPAVDAEELYRGVRELPWEAHIPAGATIAVDAHGENPELRNTKFTALKVKDALCDRLRDVRGARPDVDAKNPDLSVNVAIHPKKATVYLNLSGPSLHRRGYREDGVQTEAPLKETLAAGILLLAGWPEMAKAGGSLADPMCGSGTFAIEAAMMAADVAPGLLRTRWGFERWACHDKALWDQLVEEARGRARAGDGVAIVAGDIDRRAVDIARANARRAGVSGLMRFHVDDARNLARHLQALRGRRGGGLLVANPPYGMRLLSDASLPAVNAALAEAVSALPEDWNVALVTPDTSVDTALGRVPETVVACHNGPIEAWVRVYGAGSARLVQEVVSLAGVPRKVPIAEANSAQFAARLRKVAKERARWARKAGVTCYRVYDADLPDYALSIDLYRGTASYEGTYFAVVEEYRRPASIDAQRAARRLADASALAAALLDVPSDQVVTRAWHTPDRAARKASASHRFVSVEEGPCRFDVDLGRADTGLLLAQRGVRELAGSLAHDARTAALFATSGAALMHALAGGARAAVLVDGSRDWLDGVRRNMRASDFDEGACTTVCGEVHGWLSREAAARHRYDLVLCVAPVWLSAQDGGGVGWDLAQDHQRLLLEAAAILAGGGTILFACDDRNLRLDFAALEASGLRAENVSGKVVPHDFERSRNVPRCWLVRRA